MTGPGEARNVPATANPKMTYPLTQQFLLERNGKILRAGWGPRCVAFLLDFLIFSLPFNILGQLIWVQRALNELPNEGSTEKLIIIGIPPELHNLLWFLLFGLYATLTTRRWGATLGKRWMNLEVLKADESGIPSFLTLYGRHTLGYLSGIFLGGFFVAAVDDQKEALHDKFFKTIVVLAEPTKLENWF